MRGADARGAESEDMCRAIQGRSRDLAGRLKRVAREELAFRCGGADETCVERVSLSAGQYDDIRAIPARFVVIRGHEVSPLVEKVVFRGPDFSVVRTVGIAAEGARELADSGE